MTTLEKIRAEIEETQKNTIDWSRSAGLIDALEIIDKYAEQEPCEDAISRQAVLEMAYDMSEIDGEHFTEPHMVVDVEDIQRLPFVTQKPIECDDVVSRQAMLEIAKQHTLTNDYLAIQNLPSVRPQEHTGHWIRHDTGHSIYYDCSRCGCIAPCTETADAWLWKLSKYCPDCGAKMESEDKECI